MRFFVEGNAKADVIGVGLRLQISALASKYELQIAPRNLYDENKVEVIIRGSRQAIHALCLEIQEQDIRLFKRKGVYTVTEPEIYEGIKPDWMHYRTMLTVEQLQTGIVRYGQLTEELRDLKSDLSDLAEKLDDAIEELKLLLPRKELEKIRA